MSEKYFNKLVRDNIPDIIKANGNIPIIYTLSDNEYITYLNEKLKEEVNEYLKDNCLEEICDILEVVKAITNVMNISDEEIKKARESKVIKNGAFNNKILLEKIIYNDSLN